MTVPGSSEVAAQRTLGAAIISDFCRETAAFHAGGQTPDWLAWSQRLGSSLSGLLAALDQSEHGRALVLVTRPLPGGAALVATSDLLDIVGALDDAARCAAQHYGGPPLARAPRYRRLARSLGDGQ
jgi:hypothetical protein